MMTTQELVAVGTTAESLRSVVYNQIWMQGFGMGLLSALFGVFIGWMAWVTAVSHLKRLLTSDANLRAYYKVKEEPDASAQLLP